MTNLNNGQLVIEEGTKEIKDRQFYENSDIERIVFPDTLEVIGEEAFAGCHNLKELHFPDSLKVIKAGAFFENISLSNVELNEGLEIIGEGAFLSCEKIRFISLPETLTEIGTMAFYGCRLEKISIPMNVKEIGEQAFWGNEELKEADILNPQCHLGTDIFGTCYKLSSGYIACGYPETMELYDEILYSILALTSYDRQSDEIQETVKEYAKENSKLLMEKILNTGNAKALNTLIRLNLLKEDMDLYLEKAFERKQNEIIALLLQSNSDKGDLEL